jgi:hypothetical protein
MRSLSVGMVFFPGSNKKSPRGRPRAGFLSGYAGAQ